MRLFAALAALAVALPAWPYERARVGQNGPFTYWSTRGHSFQIDSGGTPDVTDGSASEAVRRSYATWAAVTCSDLQFPEEPSAATNRQVGYVQGATNHNLVLWRTKSCAAVVPSGDDCQTQGGCNNKYDCWDGDSKAIATTTTTSRTSTGEILDADIELNDFGFHFTTANGPPCPAGGPFSGCVAFDIQNTVTHEAGHTLGLAHSADPSATMYAFAPSGQTSKRVLAADDVDGICFVYPKGGPTATGSGSSSTPQSSPMGGGCGSAGAASWEALLVAAALRRSRQRRRP
ncbi:MAG TPA: myxosortase-dependent metalloprotease, MXAN_2677/MXAN_2678 family [Myxococcales bacterium]|nr:myxosortase-dependent metalloprotease, MXAN_2677/MXAN_2678 family [Myxococcales bacterium]